MSIMRAGGELWWPLASCLLYPRDLVKAVMHNHCITEELIDLIMLIEVQSLHARHLFFFIDCVFRNVFKDNARKPHEF